MLFSEGKMCYWKKHVSIICEGLSAQRPTENTFVSMRNFS